MRRKLLEVLQNKGKLQQSVPRQFEMSKQID